MAKKTTQEQGNDVIGFRDENSNLIVDVHGSTLLTLLEVREDDQHAYTRDEIEVIREFQTPSDGTTSLDSSPVPEPEQEFPLQTLKHLMMIASQDRALVYEIGQWGNREFTHEEIILLCYRVELPASDAEISRQILKLARSGFICKVRRNVYKACDLATLPIEDLLAQLTARDEARKRPMKPS